MTIYSSLFSPTLSFKYYCISIFINEVKNRNKFLYLIYLEFANNDDNCK